MRAFLYSWIMFICCQGYAQVHPMKLGVILTNKDSLQNYTSPPSPLYHQRFLDSLNVSWWYDYLPSVPTSTAFDQSFDKKLFGYWRVTASRSSASITADAAAAKMAYGASSPVHWFLSNEPNNAAQALESPETYAPLFKKYRDAILLGDSTAKLIGPSMVWWDSAHYFANYPGITPWFHGVGHLYGKEWYERFRAEYYRLYSVYPQLDAFNIHLYDFADFYGRTGVKISNVMAEFHQVQQDMQSYPELAGKPVWVTELGIPTFNGVTLTLNQRIAFMEEVLDSVTAQPSVERVFWFHAHPDVASPDWSPQTDLYHNNGQLSALGQAFAALSGPALPVTLSDFSVRQQACVNMLFWETTGAPQGGYFELQRSKDGMLFMPIATIEMSPHLAAHTYQYLDETVDQAHYYRLKVVDLDGASTWSSTLTVDHACPDVAFSFFPNPVQDILHIHLLEEVGFPVRITAYDNQGQVCMSDDFWQDNFQLDMLLWPSGVYLVEIYGEGWHQSFRVVK